MRRLRRPPPRELDEEELGRPWLLLVFGAAFLVYLSVRIVQMAGWALDAIL